MSFCYSFSFLRSISLFLPVCLSIFRSSLFLFFLFFSYNYFAFIDSFFSFFCIWLFHFRTSLWKEGESNKIKLIGFSFQGMPYIYLSYIFYVYFDSLCSDEFKSTINPNFYFPIDGPLKISPKEFHFDFLS